MPSFNEIFEAQKMRVGQPCATGLWRATLTQADRDQFDAALTDVGVPTSSIHRTMKAMGYEFGESAVKRHRAGGCKCSLTN
jgi:hypothetical protein